MDRTDKMPLVYTKDAWVATIHQTTDFVWTLCGRLSSKAALTFIDPNREADCKRCRRIAQKGKP